LSKIETAIRQPFERRAHTGRTPTVPRRQSAPVEKRSRRRRLLWDRQMIVRYPLDKQTIAKKAD
jgi:hypothetical protein